MIRLPPSLRVSDGGGVLRSTNHEGTASWYEPHSSSYRSLTLHPFFRPAKGAPDPIIVGLPLQRSTCVTATSMHLLFSSALPWQALFGNFLPCHFPFFRQIPALNTEIQTASTSTYYAKFTSVLCRLPPAPSAAKKDKWEQRNADKHILRVHNGQTLIIFRIRSYTTKRRT